MTGVLAFIRDRFHPLHRARKSQWFSKYFLPLLDQVFAAELKDVNHRVYLKAITHSAYYLADASVEQAEKSMMLKVLEQLPPQSIFYDVGANIGLYAWLALSRRPDLKVHLFEPDPANLSLIRRTASLVKTNGPVIHPVAVSDRKGLSIFKSDPITSATGSLERGESFSERHFNAQVPEFEVETVMLDEIAAQHGDPALMKIDVEGHEASVLAGAHELLKRAKPVLLFECFDASSKILALLQNLDYILFDADQGGFATPATTNYWSIPKGSKFASLFC